VIVLGIESSCDETSAAVLDDGVILSNEIYSQKVHERFGGVVPELASRAHLQKVDRLTAVVLEQASVALADIELIAVTDSPGLAGALLVGVSFALGLHTGFGIPVAGINHLEGHICSVLLEHPGLPFPFLALVVSGGHTAIYRVDDIGAYTCLGQTVDDAAGEAFDKVGKLLGFPYPAGRAIEEAAATAPVGGDLRFPLARVPARGLDFSFSGLKTAVKYHLAAKGTPDADQRSAVCRAFQHAVVESLARNTMLASEQTGIKNVALVGGVACNGALRRAFADRFGEKAVFPSPRLCTDNAAMIARAGFERAKKGSTRFPRMSPSMQP
jgi:N6-L-threonylcarbamoyladenine synthase